MAETQLSEPATVVMTRTVKAGREEDYRRWLTRLIRATEAFPNNLGTVVLASAPNPGRPGVVNPQLCRPADECRNRLAHGATTVSGQADAASQLLRMLPGPRASA